MHRKESNNRKAPTRSVFIAFSLLVLLSPACKAVAAQQLSPPQQQTAQQEQIVRDPAAVALLEQAWEAMGGQAWNAAAGVQLTGNAEVYGENRQNATFLLSFTASGGRDFRITDGDGNTTSSTLSGSALTVFRPRKAPEVLPLHAILNLPEYFPLGLLYRVLNDPSYSVVSAGQASIESQSDSEIEIKKIFPLHNDTHQILSKFTDQRVFVDPSTYFIRRIQTKVYSTRNAAVSKTRTIDFENYAPIGSYVQPASITEAFDGRPVLRLTVTSIGAAQ